MTTHYIDINLLPDPEFSPAHLLSALVSKLHRALVQGCVTNIGVSYPKHLEKPLTQRTLGTILRLHGTLDALDRLMGQEWLKGMRDHTFISEICPIPAVTQHRTVRRRQIKTNVDRLRRRRMIRKGETAEQVIATIPDSVERKPHLPFVQLRSSSTGQPFHLCVEHGPLKMHPVEGTFNAYGLSLEATVPWF